MSKKKPTTKKEAIRERNKKNWRIFTQVSEQLEGVDIAAPELETAAPPEKTQSQKEDEVWTAKLQTIKNRNTGRRRKATDRWNRFAGASSGSGARAR